MQISDINELFFITHISNVLSIMRVGILPHNEAQGLSHCSIDEKGVQERRQNKKIPGTTQGLHDYANLYFDAHNPMLSKRRNMNDSICVLRVSPKVLELDGVIVTDQNASREWCWFKPVEQGLPLLNKDEVFAKFWQHEDHLEQYRRKGIKCAEVLVPRCVPPSYIIGAYVANIVALNHLTQQVSNLFVEINDGMFF